ncbi:MAG: signal peptidase I [Bacillota bacterium]|nr:signal peptidase I [Bacillota bacterium]
MKVLKELSCWIANILIAMVVAVLISLFVFQPTYVAGSSMESTLNDEDRVFISKLPHTFNLEPEYGDIVVIDSRVHRPRAFVDDLFQNINNNIITRQVFGIEVDYYWIKRVIGKTGDVLEFQDGNVIKNGEILEEPYLKEPAEYWILDKVVVPEGHIFVMGDNRNDSRDSRSIGCIPISHVIGKYKFKF